MRGSSSIFLILLTTMLAKHIVAQPSQPTYLNEVCEDAFGTFSANSLYGLNLVALLSDLEGQSSSVSFYSTSAGTGANRVYGQYYCRGDTDASLCSSCVQEAAQVIQANCTNYVTASVWFDVCTLHYDNQTTTGSWEPLPRIRGWVTTNVSDPTTFSTVLTDTVDSLISTAAADSVTHFATGAGDVSALQTVYCLVQCSPNLNGTACSACLQSTFASMPRCCGEWPLQVYVFYRKCQLRYSTSGAFYGGSGSSPSPALDSSPPPPSSTLDSSPPPPSSTPDSSSSPPPPPSSLTPTPTSTTPTAGGITFGSGSDRLKLGFMTIAIGFFIFVLNA